MADSDPENVPSARFTGYQWSLFVFLSIATFFEGFDFMALAQILPNLRKDLLLSPNQGGALVGVINIGTVLSYLLVRQADRWGRRRVLNVTILGYALFTFLSGLSTSAIMFAAFQLLARLFLTAEWAVAMVFAAEEFPAKRRGLVIGLIQGCASLGAITCAGLVPMLLKTGPGWRSVYFAGALPLLLLAWWRRGLRETRRFEQLQKEREAQLIPAPTPSLFRIFSTPYATRVLFLALIWGLTYTCTNNTVLFWKEFAVGERGLTDKQVGLTLTIAAVGSLPMIFLVGRLLDVVGRRLGALIIFVATIFGVGFGFQLHDRVGLTIAMVFAVFGVSSVLSVLNAFTSELFSTELRGDAYAWANNLLGRLSNVISPFFIGAIAAERGWGFTMTATTVGPLLALALIWKLLPETRGKELEETAAL